MGGLTDWVMGGWEIMWGIIPIGIILFGIILGKGE